MDGVDSLSRVAYIYLGDILLELLLQFGNDILDAGDGQVFIVDNTLADKGGGVLLHMGGNLNLAVKALYASHAYNLR